MTSRAAFRRVVAARPALARSFHSTPWAMVRVGQEIPSLELFEDSPGNQVDLAEEFQRGNGYIIGVPAAFSGTCSSEHIPSFIHHEGLKKAGQVFVVSVNDPFVMKAWSEQLDPAKQTGIRFLGDPTGKFTKKLDLDFDNLAAIFGNARSKRYVLKVEDGKVSEAHVEPDNIL